MAHVVKPFRLGLLHRALLAPPVKQLVVSALGFFDFDEPGDLALEHKAWPRVTELLGEGAALDEGMPKPRGEVLLGGKAMAPDGKPVTTLGVSVKIGRVEKRLRAVGDRYWMPKTMGGYAATEPAPFSERPLDYTAAFGGPGFARNPLGRGHDAKELLRRGEVAPLPSLEAAAAPIGSIDDEPEPQAFGALGLGFAQRMRHAGTFDARWLADGWPGHPADMQRALFQTAAEDQRIDGFFRGDEDFALAGVHAREPLVRGKLPGMLCRCFVKLASQGERVRETPMAIDTVWLFGCIKLGVVVFRGVVRVADSDAADVSHLLVGYERLGDAPRHADHYADVLRRRTDKDTAMTSLLADSELGPLVAPAELARRREERLELARNSREAFDRLIDEQLADAKRDPRMAEGLARAAEAAKGTTEHNVDFAMPASAGPIIPAITPGDLERFDIDMAGIVAAATEAEEQAKRQADELRATGEAQQKDAQQQADARLRELGIDVDARREAEQRARVERRAGEKAPALLDAFGDTESFLAQLGQQEPPEARAAREAGFAQVNSHEAALREARRLSPEPMIVEPLSPAVASYFGELVRAGLAAGRSFRERDLAGVDLRGAHLQGLDLGGCCFETANLEGADLRGADLTRAVLTGASLRGAKLAGAKLAGANLARVEAGDVDFSEADLEGAMLIGARLRGARFVKAVLSRANALQADLGGADLGEARLEQALLVEACLEGARFDGAALAGATLLKAKLAGASLRGAGLAQAILVGVRGDDATFDDADLTGATLGFESSFARASFRRVKAARASFRRAELTEACFEDAQLDESDLGEARLVLAKLRRASLKRAILAGADLRGADLRRADFSEALLRKATFKGADLRGAQLYACNTDEASFEAADLTRATIVRTRIRAQQP